MKLAIISPADYLEKFSSQGDIEMCISTTCHESTSYLNYYKKTAANGKLVILDNGVFEKDKPLDTDKMIDLALDMMPTELVTPEMWYNKDETLKMTKDFIKTLKSRDLIGKWNLLAVAQGKTFEDLKDCFNELSLIPEIDVLGISFKLNYWDISESVTTNRLMNRLNVILKLRRSTAHYCSKPMHLMGCANPIEIFLQEACNNASPYIRSLDTSSPIVHGMNSIRFDLGTGLIGEKIEQKLDFLGKIDEKTFPDIQYNIEIMNRYKTGLMI